MYLLGALHVGVILVLVLFARTQYPEWATVNATLSIALGAIALYLFAVEGLADGQ